MATTAPVPLALMAPDGTLKQQFRKAPYASTAELERRVDLAAGKWLPSGSGIAARAAEARRELNRRQVAENEARA